MGILYLNTFSLITNILKKYSFVDLQRYFHFAYLIISIQESRVGIVILIYRCRNRARKVMTCPGGEPGQNPKPWDF